jgi:putative transposase
VGSGHHLHPIEEGVSVFGGGSRRLFAESGGGELDKTLAVRLPLAALHQALVERKPGPGLVHHSDRGLQYASSEYVNVLRQHQMIPSMSRPAGPYDNASCESFMKTLKREEIYANRHEDLGHMRVNIEEFIEQYYNRQRLHSALGYRSPEEFEQQSKSLVADSRGATVEFFENKENEKGASTGLLGKRTPTPSPSPDPFSC